MIHFIDCPERRKKKEKLRFQGAILIFLRFKEIRNSQLWKTTYGKNHLLQDIARIFPVSSPDLLSQATQAITAASVDPIQGHHQQPFQQPQPQFQNNLHQRQDQLQQGQQLLHPHPQNGQQHYHQVCLV